MHRAILGRVCGLAALVVVTSVFVSPQGSPGVASAACTPAPHADCYGAYLYGSALAGRDLNHIDLRHANLEYADLQGANLHGANLDDANLSYASLQGANMYQVHAVRTKFFSAHLNHVQLYGSQLDYANLNLASLDNVSGHAVNFAGATMEYTQLRHADLQHSNFYGTAFRDVIASGVNLTWTGNLWASSFYTSAIGMAEYYNHYVNITADYYSHPGLRFCDPADWTASNGVCRGYVAHGAHTFGFYGDNSYTKWYNYDYPATLSTKPSPCPWHGFNESRGMYVQGLYEGAHLCGVLEYHWYWLIVSGGSLSRAYTGITSGYDSGKTGQPGGPLFITLTFHKFQAYGYEFTIHGYVHSSG